MNEQVRRAAPTWLIATIAGFFGLFYAYMVWNAVAFLIQQAGRLNGLGWTVLLAAVLVPIAAFAVTLALGSKRRSWELALLQLTGLALVCVYWLNVLAYSLTSGTAMVTG